MLFRIAFFGILSFAAFAQAPTGEKLAPYYPTPETIVARMLDFGQLKPGEKMFDLGSGDGRIVIMAAQRYHADATGIELDDDLYIGSEAKIRKLGLQKTARILHQDILKSDYTSADLITVYLLPESNRKLRPVLESQLKKGTRIVAHDFGIDGWTPVKTVTIPDDGEGRSHTMFLYIR
ncbi:MAG: class I SAM-dependent methyltransferase [Acidobacteriota bacterium]|nr:class I SAM-dependent methyltransferase [Acidobacteriota bacterium]